MGKKFTEYSNFNLSDVNKEVLKDWDAKDLFHKSISEREGNPTFVFFEGPPSANGMPGIHHVTFNQGYFLQIQDYEGIPCKA